jgi:aminoglycoside phosphotransferase (APT) family kinase protein
VHTLDFDITNFSDWLSEKTGGETLLGIEPIKGGASCEMFHLFCSSVLGRQQWIVRRAPVTGVSDTAHNVMREYKIIEALRNGDVPVPQLLAASDDCAIMGAPFFVMKYIEGEVIRQALPDDYLINPQSQSCIGEELIDKLAALHAFDWRNTAIASLARPDNYLERQVERWMGQLEKYRSRELPVIDTIARWLDANRPAHGDITVMHGDYKLDNVIFSRLAPPQILSLLDFEMTTVGDPLIDLAWAMIFWPDDGNVIAFVPPGSDRGMSAEYCQTPGQLIQRYAEKTGRDLSQLQWYHAFSAWKLAIVLEGSYAKYLSGKSNNPNHQFMGAVIDTLLQRAQRFAV